MGESGGRVPATSELANFHHAFSIFEIASIRTIRVKGRLIFLHFAQENFNPWAGLITDSRSGAQDDPCRTGCRCGWPRLAKGNVFLSTGRFKVGSFISVLPLKTDALIVLVAGQNEGAMDSFGDNKSLQQRRGKLNGLATRALGDYMKNRAPVIIQIRRRRNVKLKLIAVHGFRTNKSSINCWVLGSRKLLTPSPSSRNGRETSFSRPSKKHPNR